MIALLTLLVKNKNIFTLEVTRVIYNDSELIIDDMDDRSHFEKNLAYVKPENFF